jgi:ribose/xylose/arabinose/galactoside ABC-type transport system permease subunit
MTWGLPAAILVLIIVFSIASPQFLDQRNILNVLRQSSVIAIAAAGATLVLIGGGIDISQGAIMAMSGLVMVRTIQELGLPDIVAIMAGLALGALFGMINGLLSEKVRIPSFIATLGTALIFRGFAFINTRGRDVGLEADQGEIIRWIGQGYIGPVPVPVVLMFTIYIALAIVMSRTRWGLHTYAVGSSERAARIAGLPVSRHRIAVYTVAGLLSGLAGIVLVGRLASVSASTSTGAEFDILTAVVLGGTSIYGGRGKVLRTLLGAFMLALLANGLILLNVPTFYQTVTVGAVLLGALALGRARKDQ